MRTPEYYRNLWNDMRIRPEWQARIDAAATLIRSYRCYLYDGLPADWELVGVIHYMECNCRPDRQIINGERWDKVTTLHPAGKGPFKTWKDAAIEALKNHSLQTLEDVERWNGGGYAKRNLASPYLCSGTEWYNSGKFKEIRGADGKFKSVYDHTLVSKQVGAAPILKALKWEYRDV
jgi:lysozyme family protein